MPSGRDDCARLRDAARGLIDAATRMPDAGLASGDPRYAWYFEVLIPARDALQAALDAPACGHDGTPPGYPCRRCGTPNI